ncbi:MAG: alpha-galactosidase [Clostridia bacterium]|nr:alpha-galactosidase [Clostridia bacterium]
MEFKANGITFKSDSSYKVTLTSAKEAADYLKIGIHIDFGEKTTPEPTVITWEFPSCDIFSRWNPGSWLEHSLNPDWSPAKSASRSAQWAPVKTHLSLSGKNRLTVALTDVRTPLELSSGIYEENAKLRYKLTLFTQQISAISEYDTYLILDMREIPYSEAIKDVQKLWTECGYACAHVPEEATRPMYSTWYSYHQQLERKTLIAELKLAKELGMETVIVDDGWQTIDGSRGYAYCGDWEPERLPDMKELVREVHSLGMKYMMWYSVPFVGKYSKAWERFRGKYLDYSGEECRWCVLDPRYPEVRDYLISTYENAVSGWKLDGLKLDFIDSFRLTEYSAKPNADMDYESLEDAVCALLSETKKRLLKINPEILIEFRQGYMGPVMLTCGNMIRVADCPGDPLKNRAGSLSLRLTSGSCAVHSDMLMWNYGDSVQSAALEIISILFSVPQISVLIEKLPEEHYKMLRFYLDFWNKNRDCLIFGNLTAKNPEANYSIALTETDTELAAVSFSKNVLETEKIYDKLSFVNGSWDDELLIKNSGGAYSAEIVIYDCMGNITEQKTAVLENGYNIFNVPCSGLVQVIKN